MAPVAADAIPAPFPPAGSREVLALGHPTAEFQQFVQDLGATGFGDAALTSVVPAATRAWLVVVDSDWYAEAGDPVRLAADALLIDAYRSGAAVAMIGPGASSLVAPIRGAGASFVMAESEPTELYVFMLDPFHYIQRDDGSILLGTRQFGSEIPYHRPELVSLSLQLAARDLSAWVADGIVHFAEHTGEEVDAARPCVGACPKNHRDGATTQAWVFTSNDYLWTSGLDYHPKGKMNYYIKVDHLDKDGTSAADYYVVTLNHESIPGVSSALGWSNWKNGWDMTKHDVNFYESANQLIDHGPPTDAASTTTMSYSLGVGSGGITATVGVSYTKPSVEVLDNSDSSVGDQRANHNIDYVNGAAASTNTFTSKSGVTIKDTNVGDMKFWYGVQNEWVNNDAWCSPSWWCGFSVYQTPVRSWNWNIAHTTF